MLRLGKTHKEFEDCYQLYAGGIHRTLRGMTGNHSIAEELTQEAFLKAWKGLPQFGFRSSLKTWIYQVAINLGRDWLRSHKHLHVSLPDEAESTGAEQEALHLALFEMDEDSRTLVILFYWEGMKLEEMASILSIPTGTVKSRLHAARMRLKELLLNKGFDV